MASVLTLLALVAALLGGSLASSPPAAAADHRIAWRYYHTDSPSVRATNYQQMITSLRATASSYRGSVQRTGQGNIALVVTFGDDEHLNLFFSAENMYLIGFESWGSNTPAYAFRESIERVRQLTGGRPVIALPMGSDYPALERTAGVGRGELRYGSESMLMALTGLRAYQGGATGVTNPQLARAALQVAAMTAEAARFHHISEFMGNQVGAPSPGNPLPADYLVEENNWGRLSNYAARLSQDPTHESEVIGPRRYSSFQDVSLVLAIALSSAIDRTCKRSVQSPTTIGGGSLGGELSDSPTAVSQAPNSLDVFVRGSDGHLYNKHYNGVSWHDYLDLGAPTGGGIVGIPAAASPENGRLDVFVRGSDNALWHKWYVNDTWSAWESLGGSLADSPTVISRGPGNLDVVIRATDQGVRVKSWQSGSPWTDWTVLGGSLRGVPAVVSPENGRLDVFARGSDNAIWQNKYVSGAWSGWQSLGGWLTTDPVAVPLEHGGVEVFARGLDNALWHKWAVNGTSSSWLSFGGSLADRPTAVTQAPGSIDVFVQGSGRDLRAKSWATGRAWTDWRSFAGDLRGVPAVVSPENGRLDVFVRGSDNALWHTSYVENSTTGCGRLQHDEL
ncbi:ribosome-inactivating family protein [Streptomyces sp. BE20]|uniref:ribosome-inactivating family protein n=1 Tax=unclassified Streptomyces TaxID=2593676 RepID=UPI002E78C86B|nr:MULTISPECIES: ribosome-inactivating family protein [unclassified Streptomyces]MED7947639.1 ribosome-inactivating family protein [Streptomyces sp. BE303]MEE1824078.1 ribosome-inactivating family protein [Streptomyces sp. BE20]